MKKNKYSVDTEEILENEIVENNTESQIIDTVSTDKKSNLDDPSSVVDDEHSKRINSFIKIIEKLKEMGWRGILDASLKLIFIIFIFVLLRFMLDPKSTLSYLMELQSTIQTEQHTELVEQRFKNSPIINQHLKSLRLESGMTRAFIIEFHNGNNNMANLPFYYGDMTYESTECGNAIQLENTNISLTRFEFPSTVSQDGYFFGTEKDIEEIDPIFAARIKAVGSTYLALLPMFDHNNKAIGLLGLSYNRNDYDNIDNNRISALLGIYSSKIEPLLIPKALSNNSK